MHDNHANIALHLTQYNLESHRMHSHSMRHLNNRPLFTESHLCACLIEDMTDRRLDKLLRSAHIIPHSHNVVNTACDDDGAELTHSQCSQGPTWQQHISELQLSLIPCCQLSQREHHSTI